MCTSEKIFKSAIQNDTVISRRRRRRQGKGQPSMSFPWENSRTFLFMCTRKRFWSPHQKDTEQGIERAKSKRKRSNDLLFPSRGKLDMVCSYVQENDFWSRRARHREEKSKGKRGNKVGYQWALIILCSYELDATGMVVCTARNGRDKARHYLRRSSLTQVKPC